MGKLRRQRKDEDDNEEDIPPPMSKKQKKQQVKTKVADETSTSVTEQEVDLTRLEQVNRQKPNSSSAEKRLIVVLEGAQLETVKWGTKGFGLLNVDEHAGILRKHGRDFSTSRPDITHQCLLMLLDSPLNRAGLLQVFIHTANNVLIEINPQTRIPRTFQRFAGLMVQLLHKFSVKASDSSVKLMKVIKNPVTDHLPVGCRKVLMSYGAKNVVKSSQVVPEDLNAPICVVIGAIAKGSIDVDYTEENYCIGNYPLSAALTCSKITSSFEEAWGVF